MLKILQIFFKGTAIPFTVDKEEAEIEMCKRHKRYFQEAKTIGMGVWHEENCNKGQVDVQRDINLFKARYSFSLKIRIMCNGCSEYIRGRWYRCLHCVDMDQCDDCFMSGRKPIEHLDCHEVIELRLVKLTYHFQVE